MRNLLLLAVVLGSACSSSSEAGAPPIETKPTEAKPAEAPKPEAPKPPAPKSTRPEPLPLTSGYGHRAAGLRVLEKLANRIDDAGTDCIDLSRNLTMLAMEIAKAKTQLAEHGQQFKTLPMSRALRERQKAQKAFVNQCKKEIATGWYASSIGAIRSYDYEYGGDHVSAIY